MCYKRLKLWLIGKYKGKFSVEYNTMFRQVYHANPFENPIWNSLETRLGFYRNIDDCCFSQTDKIMHDNYGPYLNKTKMQIFDKMGTPTAYTGKYLKYNEKLEVCRYVCDEGQVGDRNWLLIYFYNGISFLCELEYTANEAGVNTDPVILENFFSLGGISVSSIKFDIDNHQFIINDIDNNTLALVRHLFYYSIYRFNYKPETGLIIDLLT